MTSAALVSRSIARDAAVFHSILSLISTSVVLELRFSFS
jgi:hypothetical protein